MAGTWLIEVNTEHRKVPHLWPSQALNSIPVLLRIPGLADKVFSNQKALMTLLNELVQEHRITRDPTQPPQDLTDAFLDEIEKVRCRGQWWWFENPMTPGPGRWGLDITQ